MKDVETAVIQLDISGADGFNLQETCPMTAISRSPQSIVHQTIGLHHQYPDGFMLYLGSMFTPTKDRDAVARDSPIILAIGCRSPPRP